MKGSIYLMRKPWNYLSMINNVPILYNGFLYQNMYKLIYTIAFPSRKNEIIEMGLCKLRELQLGLEYFEVDESIVINELMNIIIERCKTDRNFLSRLKKTKDRKILNSDYVDKYFGNKKNIYGKCLMKVRDEKLYEQRKKNNE